jgi:hypothetical protein
MTTEAQIEANRANAQKSTGPRTPEGKATVAQNALKHGLLAKDAVVAGEDLDEFDLLRGQLRAELAPVTLTESLLVERIAGLSWRLRRAERFGTEAFDMLYVQCAAEPQSQRWRPGPEPGAADPVVGLTVIKDFSETKVLERLLVCERRIENSLYRTMGELRQAQEQRQGAGGVPPRESRSRLRVEKDGPFYRVREKLPPDFTLDNLLAKIAAQEKGPQTRESAFGNPDKPADATTNAPPDPSCETKPISGTAGWDEAAGAGDEGQSCETNPICEPPTAEAAQPQDLSCETKPILPAGMGPEDEKRKTNPISAAAAVETVHHSSIPSFQDSNSRPQAGGQSCETNPIGVGPGERQVPYSEGVRSNPAPSGPGETEPISAGAKRERFGYTPIFRRRR